jgi:serine/threonine protein kinase
MERSQVPQSAQALIADRLSSSVKRLEFTEISCRRGALTVKVWSGRVAALVKLALDTPDGTEANLAGIRREALVLRSIPKLFSRFLPELQDTNGSVALIEQWFDGEPAFKNALADLQNVNEVGLLNLMSGAFAELEILHVSGWAHGDLQPMHYLRVENGFVLLDYGVAQSEVSPMDNFRGGMVHFNAPEICAAILDDRTVAASPTADVFGVASVFAFALTGHVYGSYKLSESWEKMCEIIAAGDVRRRELERALTPVPRVRGILLKCLEVDPLDRPRNAQDVLSLLLHVQGSFVEGLS